MAVLRSHCNREWATKALKALPAKAHASRRPARPQLTASKPALALSKKQANELVDRYQTGASTYELAKIYEVRRSTITSYLKKAGVEIRPGSQAALDFSAQIEVGRLYGSGLSIRSIGQRMGVSDNTVLKILGVRGVKTRARRGGRKKK